MNLFIFNSKRKFGWYSSLFLVFYVSLVGSFFTFCLRPSQFYWRAWEFFDDIVFQIPSKRVWVGKELGDQSRNYLLHFQNHKDTVVSCNEDGFRSTSFHSKNYPISVFGDSHIWGSGLADQETIPWMLGEMLQVPTFNAGRGPFQILKDLSYPKVSHSKIIIEIMAEHLLEEQHYSFEQIKTEPYSRRIKDLKYTNYLSVHPKRYFILSRMARYFDPNHWFNELMSSRFDDYMMPKGRLAKMEISDEHLKNVLEHIKTKAQFLKRMGHTYVFALTPSRGLLLAHKQDENDISIEQRISRFFRENGVHYVDMCDLFRNVPNPKELYQPTDSHVSSGGARLMAKALKEYILNLARTEEICLSELVSESDSQL